MGERLDVVMAVLIYTLLLFFVLFQWIPLFIVLVIACASEAIRTAYYTTRNI